MSKTCLGSRVIQRSGGYHRGRRADGAETEGQEGVHGARDPQAGAAQLRGHSLHPPPGAQVSSLPAFHCLFSFKNWFILVNHFVGKKML